VSRSGIPSTSKKTGVPSILSSGRPAMWISVSSSLLAATMNQKSSFREDPHFVSSVLTGNSCCGVLNLVVQMSFLVREMPEAPPFRRRRALDLEWAGVSSKWLANREKRSNLLGDRMNLTKQAP
jgi:hypothetical protein